MAISVPSLPPFDGNMNVAMPPTKRNKTGPCPKHNKWWPEILKLESEGLVDLNPQGIHHETNEAFETTVHIICLLCRDSPGASNGVLSLRTPFNQHYWDCHPQRGKYHSMFYEQHIARRARNGKVKAPVQKSVTSFFTSTSITTKSSTGDVIAQSKKPSTIIASKPTKL